MRGDEKLSNLKNWHPISMLNIDYMILSKVLAKRMEQRLPKLVHSGQKGFVDGRYIGQNIRLLSGIMDLSKAGLKLNQRKTKAMWLGTMKSSNSNKLEFKSTKNLIKVLGTFLSYNQN